MANIDLETIEQFENDRYRAMLEKDIRRLDELLDERLRYIHSNGVVDSKESYLSGLRDGVWDYREIVRKDQRITPLDGSALVFNHLMIDLVVNGAAKKVDSRALAVWTLSDGKWRLVAIQSAAQVKA
ncbi:nuclear transport factor 2 family protein [Ensifer adhaerens]|uniref:nuclear transport factor 2 family protein n=1 Tax=Ensifer adhaerens TaxID=106592 RepID=UPI000FD6D0BB|nr:nuclear transport factor 2 family protein [Ensifer adhaerens]MDF8357652.1 nuclear transport factor 2 family protein [Ensifer adhaerens]THA60203.1 nuclear transport factor 2 family protein [Ensifer adhaerens]